MNRLSEPTEGGCACGAVRYQLNRAPIFVHACHCTECQRLSGSAFAVIAMIEHEQVRLLQGELHAVAVTNAGGRVQTFMRCVNCHVALWSHHSQLGPVIALVMAGTLDAPARFLPGAHLFTRSKQPWVSLPDGIPAAETHYDFQACWPADSLARLTHALLGVSGPATTG